MTLGICRQALCLYITDGCLLLERTVVHTWPNAVLAATEVDDSGGHLAVYEPRA